MQAAAQHSISARQKGWCLPELLHFDDNNNNNNNNMGNNMGNAIDKDNASDNGNGVSMELEGMSAWWMDRTDPRTVRNSMKLGSLFLLTAPNMSGKSTLMRSALVTALLANSGTQAGRQVFMCSCIHVLMLTHTYITTILTFTFPSTSHDTTEYTRNRSICSM